MGIWRVAGAFAVVKRQGECGSKTAGMHVSQPVTIGMCYGLGVLLSIFYISIKINIQSFNKFFRTNVKSSSRNIERRIVATNIKLH